MIFMKNAPNTLRAWKSTMFPVVVSYQSDMGTRLCVSVAYL